MLVSQPSTQFKRDIKRVKKQRKNVDHVQAIIKILANQEPLEKKYQDHALIGEWGGYRECHIEPDLLLIYRVESKQTLLRLARLGSHANLFKK